MAKMRHTKKRRRAKGAGCIIKDKKSGMYYYYWHDTNGKQHKKSLRTKNEQEAQAHANALTKAVKAEDQKEVLLQSAKIRKIIHEKDLPLADVWSAFIKSNPTAGEGTLKNYKRMLDEFIFWLSSERPSINSFTQIDLELAIAYMENIWQGKKSDSGYIKPSANTYNYKRGALVTITKALQNKYGIETNCWLKTGRKEGVQQKRLPLNRKQVSDLLKLVDSPKGVIPYRAEMACLVKFCLFAGMRLIDAVNVKWENINFETGYLTYTPEKTKRTSGAIAKVLILPPLYNALSSFDDSNEYILPQVQAHYARNPDYVKKTLLSLIIQATGDKRNKTNAQSSVKRRLYGTHSLRGTFATECAKVGCHSNKLARMLGDTIKTIDRFYVDADLTTKPVPGYTGIAEPQKQITDPERAELQILIDNMQSKQITKLLKTARDINN